MLQVLGLTFAPRIFHGHITVLPCLLGPIGLSSRWMHGMMRKFHLVCLLGTYVEATQGWVVNIFPGVVANYLHKGKTLAFVPVVARKRSFRASSRWIHGMMRKFHLVCLLGTYVEATQGWVVNIFPGVVANYLHKGKTLAFVPVVAFPSILERNVNFTCAI